MPKFIPRDRKQHKTKKDHVSHQAKHVPEDTNVIELVPQSAVDREARRQRLKEELRAQNPQVSSKKQKRLDKYIETKLRKEEGLDLLKKLAASKIDTSTFLSSSRLGQQFLSGPRDRQSPRKTWDGVETFSLDSDSQSQDGIGDEDLERAAHSRDNHLGTAAAEINLRTSSSLDDGVLKNGGTAYTSHISGSVKASRAILPVSTPYALPGGGLKRPLDIDAEGRPVLKKRRIRQPVSSRYSQYSKETDLKDGSSASQSDQDASDFTSEDNESDSSWDGFESEATTVLNPSESTAPTFSIPGANVTLDPDAHQDDPSSEEISTDDESDAGERISGFKAWAMDRRNEAIGHQPTVQATDYGKFNAPGFVARESVVAPSIVKSNEGHQSPPHGEEIQPVINRKANVVNVTREEGLQAARLALPILAEEQNVMEVIHNNDGVIICGATGSGKTTQVPQFLYEAGYGKQHGTTEGMIGITQPRRVAAVSMSKRVAQELGDHGSKVAHQIRFEGTVKADTTIKFMTDGVLLREVSQDIALRKYSAVIIDEAHERSINTDILLGIMSRTCKLRTNLHKENPAIQPLKLIIMSATLRLPDLISNSKLFPIPPPVVEVGGRQHAVTLHFARRTQRDYLDQVYRKIVKGHPKLPPGGMLVFLTGQDDIRQLQRRLLEHDGRDGSRTCLAGPRVQVSGRDTAFEAEDLDLVDDAESIASLSEGHDSSESDGSFEEEQEHTSRTEFTAKKSKLHVLSLYSLLPTDEQMKVFDPPPHSSRLVVLATNIAETSLTIPNIRYVFDCGRAKQKKYDRATGVQSFETSWISKASALQRMGRAGRTGPGHCYRLYSSAVFERDFPEFAEPEIRQTPIEAVVLQLKAMNLQNVQNFPFPTSPDPEDLRKAELLLGYIGATDIQGRITDLGRVMTSIPVSPRFARILAIGNQRGCLPFVIAIVAALSVNQILLSEPQADILPKAPVGESSDVTEVETLEEQGKRSDRRRAYNASRARFADLERQSDALQLLSAVCASAHEPDLPTFCHDNFLNLKGVNEANKLRRQLTEIIHNKSPGLFKPFESKLPLPNAKQKLTIRQILASGFLDNVAIRGDLAPRPPATRRRPRGATDVPYLPLFSIQDGTEPNPDDLEACVFVHPSSPLAHVVTTLLPSYVVYRYLQRATPRTIEDPGNDAAASVRRPRVRMHALTPISGKELTALAVGTSLISYGKPLPNTTSMGQRSAADAGDRDSISGLTRECAVMATLGAGNGRAGWPMGIVRVRQRTGENGSWVVEKLLG